MSTVLYLWLLGVALVGVGGMLVGRGWWLDKAAGNHKRARCRKCWYELGATASSAEGVTVCPECGTRARGERDLHRVRRQWWVALAGLALVCGGVFLAGRPLMAGGNWLYLLPRWAAARLWKPLGAEGYGREVKQRVARGTATDAEVESVAEGAKDVVARGLKAGPGMMAADMDAALLAMANDAPDPEADGLAAAVLVQGPFNSKAAVKYFEIRGVSMARRVELCEDAIAKRTLTSPPTGYYEMLSKASDDAAAMRGLARAASNGSQWDGFARHQFISAKEPALAAAAAEFRASKDVEERKRLAKLFHEAFAFHGTAALTPFVLELADDPVVSNAGMSVLQYHSDKLKVPDEKLKEWILGSDATRREFALQQIGCFGDRRLPEGCGKVVMAMVDRGEPLPCAVASKFSGADRLLWVERLEKGSLTERRGACEALAQVRPVLKEGEAALRKIESDAGESEEMRVAARDALRHMGVWRE